MTPKQRAKIYRKAAEKIDDRTYMYCCQALAYLKEENWLTHPKASDFPEFFMFKPKLAHYAWWDSDNEPRILALLLCEQMCLNP